MSNAPTVLNEKTFRDLCTNPALEGLNGVILMELHSALYDLGALRRSFAADSDRIIKNVEEAVRIASEPGRTPNQCGVTQNAPALEVTNGRIAETASRARSLIRIAVKAGLLPAAVYVV